MFLFGTIVIAHALLDQYAEAINGIIGLLFAIFAGNFAFTEFRESKASKLREAGHQSFKRQDYHEAINRYEEALRYDRRNFSSLAELGELYLIKEHYDVFSKLIVKSKRVVGRPAELLVFYYLEIVYLLASEQIGEAKRLAGIMCTHISDNPEGLDNLNWNFGDITHSKAGVKDRMGEACSQFFDLLVRYLKKEIDQRSFRGVQNL